MARAKRHYIPGYTWHITHRCHKGEFLLKFARDKLRWIEWLYQSNKRYRDLSVLNYMVTSNHIHLLVSDSEGRHVIPDSIKLVAGRTAQEYNTRKKRKGAFWEDRYHATAVDKDRYLRECIAYIDLNMVRAGVVSHPSEWEFCGYNEIQNPRQRKGIIDFEKLMDLVGLDNYSGLKKAHFKWVNQKLQNGMQKRERQWTKGIAVGSQSFVENVKDELGFRAIGRKIFKYEDIFELRERHGAYGETIDQSYTNDFFWE